MSELKRRTPEETEIYFLSHISELTYKQKAFEAHAVEVLAIRLAYIDLIVAPYEGFIDYDEFEAKWGNVSEINKNRYRAEARELLGIKE